MSQPLSISGQLSDCMQPEHQPQLIDLLRRSSATVLLEVSFFLPRLEWSKSKLAPIAVLEVMGLAVMWTTMRFPSQVSYEPFIAKKNNWILLLPGTLKVLPSDWRQSDCGEVKQSLSLWREGALVASDEWTWFLLLKEKWFICLGSLVHLQAHCQCMCHHLWLNGKASVDFPRWKTGFISCCNIFIPRETKNFRHLEHNDRIAGGLTNSWARDGEGSALVT